MQIDRRVTNGLAWAGALLVVGIPAADFFIHQFQPAPTMQVAIAEEPPGRDAPRPTSLSQRPAETVAAQPAVKAPVSSTPATATAASTPAPARPAAKPVAVAEPASPVTADDVVSTYLQSGRALPSYISGGNGTPAKAPAATQAPVQPRAPATSGVTAQPPAASPQSAPPASGEPEIVAARPAKAAPVPAPLEMRPPSQPSRPVQTAPLVVPDTAPGMVTAQDLEDWESGPLSDFLARRQQGSPPQPVENYDPNGFFLDQGPNNPQRNGRFPRAYDDGDYFIIR